MHGLVFDSGVGGVGVAQAIRRLMPQARLTYLMDDAGFPYGNRAQADLAARLVRVLGAALARGERPDLVVVACNTASTAALDSLRASFDLPFIGCVPPVRWAARVSRSRRIGVLATPATAKGAYLRDLAARFAADCRIVIHGAAGLASLAERRFAGHRVTEAEIADEVSGFIEEAVEAEIDAVALGCTHYAWLLPELRAGLDAQVAWLDPAEPVARQALRVAAGLTAATAPQRADTILATLTPPILTGACGWTSAGFLRAEKMTV
jgi:glutamate racemase